MCEPTSTTWYLRIEHVRKTSIKPRQIQEETHGKGKVKKKNAREDTTVHTSQQSQCQELTVRDQSRTLPKASEHPESRALLDGGSCTGRCHTMSYDGGGTGKGSVSPAAMLTLRGFNGCWCRAPCASVLTRTSTNETDQSTVARASLDQKTARQQEIKPGSVQPQPRRMAAHSVAETWLEKTFTRLIFFSNPRRSCPTPKVIHPTYAGPLGVNRVVAVALAAAIMAEGREKAEA